MPKASVKRLIECKKEQLIDLVLDIEEYPTFVPFCLGAKVYEKKEKSDYKPGLKKSIQYFLKSKKYNQNFSKYHKYLKLYEKIFN